MSERVASRMSKKSLTYAVLRIMNSFKNALIIVLKNVMEFSILVLPHQPLLLGSSFE